MILLYFTCLGIDSAAEPFCPRPGLDQLLLSYFHFERCYPDSNRDVVVYGTLALPLGYSTIHSVQTQQNGRKTVLASHDDDLLACYVDILST